jgi:hypothetical protein
MKRANIVMLSAVLSLCFAGGHAHGRPWAVVNPQITSSSSLSSALDQLQGHIDGTAPLPGPELQQIGELIAREGRQLASSADILRRAFKIVEAYETKSGPLFLNPRTRNGFARRPTRGLELDRTMFELQQALLDHAYTPENLVKYRSVLEGAAFKTSAYFPGRVAAAPDPNKVYRVKINASLPTPWGSPVMFDEDPARRPTGCYLSPGSIAEVTVPPALVGKGYAVRVGAHSWDLRQKPTIKRLDRVSLVFPIEAQTTLVANPLGGGMYIEVPPKANAGLVEVTIRNVVRSPFFSARSFDKTSLAQWRTVERQHPGPWADFESDKFMMQVPTSWIYRYDDPARLLSDWDKALDVVSALFGRPKVRPKSVLYLQVDVVIRGDAYYPGYPQSNFSYNPHKPENGNSDHWLLKGPQSDGATIFHELGHAQLFTKFNGEVEAVVNLPYVAVLNKGFGVPLDQAFGRSFDQPAISLDQAAIMWMVTQNFRDGKPMDISDSERNEVRYQHRGYAKYVEIANLFGWNTLEKFWRTYQLDYLKGIQPEDRNADPTDGRILRLSRQAGCDLTPLIHFWGVQPDNPAELRAAIAKHGLRPSAKIYDRLVHYMTLIPMSREEFARHAAVIYPKGIRPGQNPNYGEGWYYVWLQKYDRSHGEAARAALQRIIDTYFPHGRPKR